MTTELSQKSRLVPWKVLTPILVLIFIIFVGLAVIRSQIAHNPPHSEDVVEIRKGSILPSFSLTRFPDGKSVQISEIPAKVYVVNFWATWCEACMEEMPSLVKLAKTYKSQGLEVIGINLDENPDAVIPRTARKYEIDFSIFKDPDGKAADLFDVHAIPLTVIFNKGRKILYTKDGELNWMAPEIITQMDRWLSD